MGCVWPQPSFWPKVTHPGQEGSRPMSVFHSRASQLLDPVCVGCPVPFLRAGFIVGVETSGEDPLGGSWGLPRGVVTFQPVFWIFKMYHM